MTGPNERVLFLFRVGLGEEEEEKGTGKGNGKEEGGKNNIAARCDF